MLLRNGLGSIFQCFFHKLHLFNPVDGRDYSTLSLGKNIEASVAVYNDMLVVASYNQKIYGIKLS